MINKKHLIVIGGGAAGFFCAVNAARLNKNLEVTIIEKTGKLLSKVRVSGGGRCNVTHDCRSIAEMIKKYPRGANFLKKAFHQFFTTDTIKWFEERGVMLKTEADGRMFPVSDSSQSIIDCLVNEVQKYGVKVMVNAELESLTRVENIWQVDLKGGKKMTADFVCVACGGNAKSSHFTWLEKLRHTMEPPAPSLFTFNMPGNPITDLMGISLENVKVRIPALKLMEEGPLLITHWGMSGPAILKLSAWGAKELVKSGWQFSITINWIPGYNENSLRESIQKLRFEMARQKIVNRNPFGLPQRLWEFLIKQAGISDMIRWADLPAKEQNILVKLLCSGEFKVSGKTTFKEEFVTCGGIKLDEIDVQTMQSKIQQSLYFAGEILDVDGITGGFNFQNAWTTAFIAAHSIAGRG